MQGQIFSLLCVSLFALLVMLQYCLRSLGSSHRKMVLRDYGFCYGQAVIFSALLSVHSFWLTLGVCITAILLFTLQWGNAVSLRFFGIKANRHMLQTAVTGVGGLVDETAEVAGKVFADIKLPALWFLGVMCIALWCFATPLYVGAGFVALYILVLNVLTKSKLDRVTSILWLVAIAVFEGLFLWLQTTWLPYIPDVLSYGLFLWLSLALVTLYVYQYFFSENVFFILPCLIKQQFVDEKLSLEVLQHPPQLSEVDAKLAAVNLNALKPSAEHGLCEGASVVLITVESLSDFYFTAQEQRELMPFFTELKAQGISSQQHISPSALTNNALRAIYAGAYARETAYPHMQHLQQMGYQTGFLTSQRTSEFNLDAILTQIGFEHIIDNASLSGGKLKRMPDNEFFPKAFDALTNVIDLQKPFFIHLMNNQTHGPYFTYEEKLSDRKQRYLQAIKESDAQMKRLVDKIKNQNNNVMIIYTGDHGESFGEEGYMSHANAVIGPQIQVPFVLQHAKLAAKTCDFSSHFDLLPTVFDLLGKPYDYEVLGNSLYVPNDMPHCFAYCETRMGNTPSSFCMVTPMKKIYFDRHLANYQIRDSRDKVLQNLTGEQYDYYLKFLLQCLHKRQLIYK